MKSNVKVGDTIHIYYMVDCPEYSDVEGIVEYIDERILTGSWGYEPVNWDDDWEVIANE